jgi:uncharacterized membrane protein YfcA
MCSIGGIGGAGIVIPLLMIFFTFDTKNAIAISAFSILLASISRYIYNIKDRHPEKDAVCFDYGIAIVMLPTVMMGSFLGVLLNVVLPTLVI